MHFAHARTHESSFEDPTAGGNHASAFRVDKKKGDSLKTSVTPVAPYPSSSHMTATKFKPAGCVKLVHEYGEVAVDGSVKFWMKPCVVDSTCAKTIQRKAARVGGNQTYRLNEDVQLPFGIAPRQVERLALSGIANVVLECVAVC
jgi:hypothetical protein